LRSRQNKLLHSLHESHGIAWYGMARQTYVPSRPSVCVFVRLSPSVCTGCSFPTPRGQTQVHGSAHTETDIDTSTCRDPSCMHDSSPAGRRCSPPYPFQCRPAQIQIACRAAYCVEPRENTYAHVAISVLRCAAFRCSFRLSSPGPRAANGNELRRTQATLM
jgi:hypothetical protein